jgi:hypothetical protein
VYRADRFWSARDLLDSLVDVSEDILVLGQPIRA